MQKIIILAGNRQQFEGYLEHNGLTDSQACYGFDARSLFGIEASGVIEIGTFYERKDASELRRLAHSRVRPLPLGEKR
jgi:hypothetical protein